MSAVVKQGSRPSETGLTWWDVKLTLDDDGKDRLVHCTFLALDEAGARLRGIEFAKNEKQQIKLMVASPADAANRTGMVPLPADHPKPETKREKPRYTPEELRAIAAFTLVPFNFPTVRLYTSDEGGST